MANQQLVDYVTQQKKAGVASEVIKKALLDSGWGAQDVDEAMNPVVSAAAPSVSPQPQIQPQPKAEPMPASFTSPASPVASPVSVSVFDSKNGPMFQPKSPLQAASPAARPSQGVSVAAFAPARVGDSLMTPAVVVPRKKSIILPIIMGIIIIALGVVGYMFWSQNAGLEQQITSLTADKAALTAQVDSEKKTADDSQAQTTAITDTNKDLESQLSLFVGPPNATSTPVTVKGVLEGSDKIAYSLTTSKGAVLFIKNYKDPATFAALTPLIGKTVEITGPHVLGSKDITITALNGAAIPPLPPASTTASSTTPAASSTTP